MVGHRRPGLLGFASSSASAHGNEAGRSAPTSAARSSRSPDLCTPSFAMSPQRPSPQRHARTRRNRSSARLPSFQQAPPSRDHAVMDSTTPSAVRKKKLQIYVDSCFDSDFCSALPSSCGSGIKWAEVLEVLRSAAASLRQARLRLSMRDSSHGTGRPPRRRHTAER